MADVNFIELFGSLEEALTERTSPQIDLYEVRGIHLLPNNEYPYVQSTNVSGGIELEDWTCIIVNTWDNSETDITDYFTVESTFNDVNGYPQFVWSLTNVPFDFGYKMVYLKVSQTLGETFYSNMFQLTSNDSEKTTRIDYKSSANDNMKSIQIRMWYWQTLKNQEIKTYYETSTKNTVTNVIKSQKYEKWLTDVISNSLFLKLSDVFEQKFVYVSLIRSYLFENIEIKEHSGKQNFARNIINISTNANDVYNPLEVIVEETLIPSITLSSVVANGTNAIYTFIYENFIPQYLVYEYSDDQVTWTSNNQSITSPKSITFNELGTWYFRIKHPEAISNVITLILGEDVIANDDSITVTTGGIIDYDVLFNDGVVGTTTVTLVSTPTNGVASIIESGTKIRYVHDGGVSLTDSFTYTISNGTTSDTATVSVSIISGLSSILMNGIGTVTKDESCAISFGGAVNFLYDGSLVPQIGDTFYRTETPTIPFNGYSLWYQIDGGRSVKINENGIIIDKGVC